MLDLEIDVINEHIVIELLASTVRLVGSLAPKNMEVVLHDLRTPERSIIEITNSTVSGRKKGQSVLSGGRQDKAFEHVMALSSESVSFVLDYETYDSLGKPLRSSSAIYRNQQGKPYAALCINVDYAQLNSAIEMIQQLTGIHFNEQQKYSDNLGNENNVLIQEPTAENIDILMQEIIDLAIQQNPGTNRIAVKKANLSAVQRMLERGIFIIKGGVEKAAKALGVSRYTIYNYLDELKVK
ncbi:PAS domain-containing protein [Shewanella sp. SP2S2-6]|uniref:helix-turn-helix transcriptional regulator n=1 Tax=Shewanella sp. SP2S2-6 TaxID=3063540 RepID=UPI00288F5A0D|nr:PAS domain-containing protein [Shewanella sp. SP2S2-6]MDT3297527.1 PAS domain-containing protein [Shewanella sp. SP2S2-6]